MYSSSYISLDIKKMSVSLYLSLSVVLYLISNRSDSHILFKFDAALGLQSFKSHLSPFDYIAEIVLLRKLKYVKTFIMLLLLIFTPPQNALFNEFYQRHSVYMTSWCWDSFKKYVKRSSSSNYLFANNSSNDIFWSGCLTMKWHNY